MTLFRVGPAGGGGGIPSALKNAMNAVFNKKFETSSVDYPPEDWPDEVNLLGPLPEKSGTGNLVHCPDGAKLVPLAEWKVNIPYTSAGVSSLSCSNTGKNHFSPLEQFEQMNISATSAAGSTYAEIKSASTNRISTVNLIRIPAGHSWYVSCASGFDLFLTFFDSDQLYLRQYKQWTDTKGFTSSECAWLGITLRKSDNSALTPSDADNAKIQLEISLYPTEYADWNYEPESVSLGQTIYGGIVDLVRGTVNPRNLFDKNNPNEVDGYIDISAFKTSNTNAKTVYIPIVGGATYTVSKTAGVRFQVATSETIPSNNAPLTNRQANNTASSITITASANDKYLWAWVFLDGTDSGTLSDMLDSVQIEEGGTTTTYQPYFTPFTIQPCSIARTSRKGVNDFECLQGISEVTYRANVEAHTKYRYLAWIATDTRTHDSRYISIGALQFTDPNGTLIPLPSSAVVSSYPAVTDFNFSTLFNGRTNVELSLDALASVGTSLRANIIIDYGENKENWFDPSMWTTLNRFFPNNSASNAAKDVTSWRLEAYNDVTETHTVFAAVSNNTTTHVTSGLFDTTPIKEA